MAGAADADVQLIGQAFPGLPLNGSLAANRKAAREYVGARKELLAQVLAQDLDAVPEAATAKPPPFYTARELLETVFPEQHWAVPDILLEGLALLAGRPKMGKSWLALQIASAVGTGGMTLGRTVEPGLRAVHRPGRRLPPAAEPHADPALGARGRGGLLRRVA